MRDSIYIKGARENNLKNIDLEIPREKLVVLSLIHISYANRLTLEAKEAKPPQQSEMMRSLTRLVQVIGIAIIPLGVLMAVKEIGISSTWLFPLKSGMADWGKSCRQVASERKGLGRVTLLPAFVKSMRVSTCLLN